MSVQSQITRIATARDSAFAEIALKGVTVPSSAKIDDLPTLISSIVSGGGNGGITQDSSGFLVLDEEGSSGGGGGGISIDDLFNALAPSDNVLLPTATRIPDSIFEGNTLIQTLSAPSAEYVGALSFYGCSNLKTVNLPEVLKICPPFSGTTKVNKSTFDANTYVGTFIGCHNLELVHLPKANYVGSYAFDYVGNGLSTGKLVIVLPKVINVWNMCFRAGKFKAIDIGGDCVKIWNDAFYRTTCGAVILRSTTLVTAATRDAVRGITNLYVPSSLVSSYQTATNWVTDSATRTVQAIEGSIYETKYADGTPIAAS